MILDPHVHLRDWSQAYKETIFHAFVIAGRLGVRGLIEMPNTSPPLTARAAVERRLELAAQAAARCRTEGLSPIHYAMHLGLSHDERQVREAVRLVHEYFPQVVGLKLYAGHSTGNMGIVEGSAQHRIYAALAEESYEGVLAVHCEAESLIDTRLFDPARPESHSEARPEKAEIFSIEQQLALADLVGFPGQFHVAHISTAEGVGLVQAAKARGQRASCGVTPHHCLLSLDAQSRPSGKPSQKPNSENEEKLGNLLKVNPPLRTETQRKRLWRLLLEGHIDWIESDHAPHAPHEKTGAEDRAVASGIPGLTGIRLLYERLKQSGLPQQRLAELCCQNALNAYRLPWADFAAEPPPISALDWSRLREADGSALYGGTDPYPRLATRD